MVGTLIILYALSANINIPNGYFIVAWSLFVFRLIISVLAQFIK